jgi:hypothetical protein
VPTAKASASLESRATMVIQRSYVAKNCVHCSGSSNVISPRHENGLPQ